MKTIYSFKEEDTLVSPQLVFYKEIIEENIDRMIEIAKGPSRLWPHIKTHKSLDVTKMLVEKGIDRFKCATIAEMEMAAMAGAKRLVLAYPVIGPNQERFFRLTRAFPEVECFAIADDTEMVSQLGGIFAEKGEKCHLLMDIDMGQHRTGVAIEKAAALYRAWAQIPGINMRGMHLYDGHRHESDASERLSRAAETDDKVAALKKQLESEGFSLEVMIFGGTPGFPCHEALTDGFLSPGTCVLQDAGYRDAYPDLPFVPGACVMTRVISRPTEDTLTLDLGCKAVATDPPIPRAEIVGMEYAKTILQNEEHLVLRIPPEHIKDIPPIGTVLYAIPVHICPTSALYPSAAIVEKGQLAGWWEITARNRKITY